MRHYANFAVETAPSSSIASGDSSFDVDSTTDYPSNTPFIIVVFEGGDTPAAATTKEMMRVTDVTTGTFTVDRDIDGYNGSGQSFTTSASVRHVGDQDDFFRAFHQVIYTGNWVTPFQDGGTSSDAEGRYMPFYMPHRMTLTDVAINVTSAGSSDGVVRIGLYNVGTDGLPATLHAECGTVAADTTGAKTITSLTIDMPPGPYFLAIRCESFTTLPTLTKTDLEASDMFSPLRNPPFNNTKRVTFRATSEVTGSFTDNPANVQRDNEDNGFMATFQFSTP